MRSRSAARPGALEALEVYVRAERRHASRSRSRTSRARVVHGFGFTGRRSARLIVSVPRQCRCPRPQRRRRDSRSTASTAARTAHGRRQHPRDVSIAASCTTNTGDGSVTVDRGRGTARSRHRRRRRQRSRRIPSLRRARGRLDCRAGPARQRDDRRLGNHDGGRRCLDRLPSDFGRSSTADRSMAHSRERGCQASAGTRAVTGSAIRGHLAIACDAALELGAARCASDRS